jgi:integrase
MGDIRRRPGRKVWQLRYYDARGVRRIVSAETTDYDVAKDKLKILEGECAKGAPTIEGHYLFDQGAADIVAEYRMNDRDSLADLKRRLTLHLTPWFRGKRLNLVSTADIRAYTLARKDESAANATINRELAVLKRIFTLALQARHLIYRPHIPMLKEQNTRRGFFERHEFEAVLQHLAPELQALATCAYTMGWRLRSELLALEWRHIDRQEGTIRLDPGMAKNEEGRVFTYGVLPALVTAIDACWAQHEQWRAAGQLIPWVFCWWTGRRARHRIRSFRGAWRNACVAAGCPGRIPHDFRRTAVRELERVGVPRSAAMAMVGHKTESIYRRYAIVAESDLAEHTRKLAATGRGAPARGGPNGGPEGKVLAYGRKGLKQEGVTNE